MDRITGKQLQEAMIANNTDVVVYREDDGTSSMMYYFREGDDLFLEVHRGCHHSTPIHKSWDEIADMINQQQSYDVKCRLATLFGISCLIPQTSEITS